MSVVEVSNLFKTFKIPRGDDIEVLKGISLNVDSGEFIAIMGPSGSGKSTLLNILSSVEDYNDGIVVIDGINLANADLVETRRQKTSIVYQDFNLLAYLTAIENVMFPMMITGISEKEARNRALELLEKVHLKHRANHTPDDLSGGEQQRVAIARALANNPKVLLADEPTGNLDSKTGDSIIDIFREIVQEKKSVIMVTHNLQVAKKTNRILILRDGKLHREEDVFEEI
jgi:putative ABC transport system ATP-binding protein